jgi:hypothetical protein
MFVLFVIFLTIRSEIHVVHLNGIGMDPRFGRKLGHTDELVVHHSVYFGTSVGDRLRM